MKLEFKTLLDINLDNKYFNHIKDNLSNTQSYKLEQAFSQNNLLSREDILEKELLQGLSIDRLKGLANPYYIGFGNPNSNVLIIGKEKAFEVDNLQLMIKESINNYSQWVKLANLKLFDADQKQFLAEFGFSPLLPKAFHDWKTPRKHTWGIINLIVKKIVKNSENILIDESNFIDKSIFNHCFLTELNHIPAKYNEGSGLADIRKDFFKHEFFKTFSTVIIGAKNYLNKTSSIVMRELFDASFVEDIIVGSIGTKRKRDLVICKYQSKKQTIFICDQLSGASGWSNEALDNFSKEITGANNV